METLMIRDLPAQDRPRERLLLAGSHHLTNAELLAILLRNGTKSQSAIHLAQSILMKLDGLHSFNELTVEELTCFSGVGPNKAVLILAAVELGKRVSRSRGAGSQAMSSPRALFEYLSHEMRHFTQEHFVVLFLDSKNQVLGWKTIFVGSLNKALVHPREVFKEAVKRSSAALICCHNHPSGDPTPSAQDIQLTHRLEEAGEVLGIPLLDHVILGEDRFLSLKEEGHF